MLIQIHRLGPSVKIPYNHYRIDDLDDFPVAIFSFKYRSRGMCIYTLSVFIVRRS